jgi:ATP-dependent Clp protease ATP-binding subunit ClpA
MSAATIVAAAQLSHRYITGRFLPDKAFDCLDEACASIRVQSNIQLTRHQEIRGLERAGGRTGTQDRVQLVNEENDIDPAGAVLDLLQLDDDSAFPVVSRPSSSTWRTFKTWLCAFSISEQQHWT